MTYVLPPKTPDPLAPNLAASANPPAQHVALLLGLLAGALLSQSLVWPVALRLYDAEWPDVLAIIAMGIAFAQIGLAAILLVLCVHSLAVRGLFVLLLYAGAALLAFRSVRGHGMSGWMSTMVMCLAITSAPLVIARLAGVAIVPRTLIGSPRGSRQYTIWGLLVLTTLVAVLLGIGRQLNFPWRHLGEIALFSVTIAAIPCLLAPLALSKVPWPATLIAAATLCPATGVLIALTEFAPDQPLELAAMASIQGAVILTACLVARVAGYRLTGPWDR